MLDIREAIQAEADPDDVEADSPRRLRGRAAPRSTRGRARRSLSCLRRPTAMRRALRADGRRRRGPPSPRRRRASRRRGRRGRARPMARRTLRPTSRQPARSSLVATSSLGRAGRARSLREGHRAILMLADAARVALSSQRAASPDRRRSARQRANRARLPSPPCSPSPAPSPSIGVDGRPVHVEVDIGGGPADVHDRRPARRRGARVARAGARGAGQLAASSSRSSGSPPTSRRRTCARPGRASTWRSPPRCSPPPASCRAACSTIRRWPASSRSTARSGPCPARWRWPRRPASWGMRGVAVAPGDARRGRAGRGTRGGSGRPRQPAARARGGRDRAGAARGAAPLRPSPAGCPTSPISAASPRSAARSRSPRPAATACCSIGPPGAGKTLAAQRLPSILPPLSADGGDRGDPDRGRLRRQNGGPRLAPAVPGAAPHDLAAGLVGGGAPPRPGEVTSRAPRRALPRRARRVPPRRPRGAAPAARGGRRRP